MIDVMPDIAPIISAVDEIPRQIVTTGFSGHGFGVGPDAGHLVADMGTGAKPIADSNAFRFKRYFDGTMPPAYGGL